MKIICWGTRPGTTIFSQLKISPSYIIRHDVLDSAWLHQWCEILEAGQRSDMNYNLLWTDHFLFCPVSDRMSRDLPQTWPLSPVSSNKTMFSFYLSSLVINGCKLLRNCNVLIFSMKPISLLCELSLCGFKLLCNFCKWLQCAIKRS